MLSAALLMQMSLQAQITAVDKWTDLLPPPPNASAIVKYGELTLSKNTGVPNVQVPLFTVSSKKLSAGVSLGYSSSGIKVDEIASRVGMGWALNAGGVITRTVRGTADELNTRSLPYATVTMNWSTYNYMKRIGRSLSTYGNQGGYDAEPDLFNYNFGGQGGKFILDSNMAVMPIPITNNKFQYNFSGSDWNFKITTPDGVAYYFGGNGAVEKTKREQICGKLFDSYITTAWYLKKIEHPNGDNIRFVYDTLTYRYDNGVAQSMYWLFPIGTNDCTSGSVPALPNSSCTNLTVTQGVLLKEIIVDNNSKVKFYYGSRDDCEDKLVTKVELVDLRANTTVSFYRFNYTTVTSNATYTNSYYQGHNKTPYLMTLVENSGDSSLQKTHYFRYNDPGARPARLSYSQDHWGYFNGQVNTTLIATPAQYLQERFPGATANREPYPAYAAKGLLSKVTYPTGGMDSLIYEGNDFSDETGGAQPLHSYTCSVTGTSFHTQVTRTSYFNTQGNQNVELDINCIDNTGNGGFDPLHNKGKVEILNSSNAVVFSELLTPGTTATRFVYLSSSPTAVYTLKLYANGTAVTTEVTLKHRPVSGSSNYVNTIIGGLRVKYVLRATEGEQPKVKRYHYAHLPDLGTSSNTFNVRPDYLREFYHFGFCSLVNGTGGYNYQASALQSNSVISMNDFNYSTLSYRGVVESHGEHFENGGVYSKFSATSDAWGELLMGEPVINAPKANFSSILNGSLLEETIFKKTAANVLVPLKKTVNNYKIETSRNARTDYGYFVHDRVGSEQTTFDTTCDLSINPDDFTSCLNNLRAVIGSFGMLKYEIMSRWTYIDTTWDITYDQLGQNPVTSTKVFYYDSASHMLLTRTEESDSKGNVLKKVFKYPHNYRGTAVYDSMIAKHIIAEAVDAKTYFNTTETGEVKVNYAAWSNNNYQPASFQKSVNGGPLDTETTIDLCDAAGNVLQFTGKNGIVTSFIWGYNNTYPVAKVIGATYNQCKNELSVDTSQLQSLAGDALLAELHRIRTGLPQAQVTALTYKHLAGVASMTDPANRKSGYTYDAFHRLQVVRDQDSNIVKKMAYSYAGPDSTHKFTVYASAYYQQNFYIQGCQPGYVAGQVSFSAPAGMFISVKSQAAADSLAQAYVQANGQVYANQHGLCDNTLPCTGIDRKLVDCLCKLAIKIYTDTYQNQNGTWTCVYHWRYADNTNSQSFTEINSAPCYGGD